jgi:hypothetical protein
MDRRLVLVVVAVARVACAAEAPLTLPALPDACRFAVIGDSGTGGEPQYRIGEALAEAHARFPFDLVLMLGDNIYGADRAADMERKFTRPYKALLDAGVVFRATLGNHDDPSQRFFAPFHMEGRRYYTYRCAGDSVRFFVLDSTYMTPEQVTWLEDALRTTRERWKICYFHHPIYSTGGTHGSDVGLRQTLEPLFVAHDVDVVLSGHDHFYERLRPQHGVQYFVSGSAGKLNRDDIGRNPRLFAKGFDQGYHFMLVEIAGDALFFQAVSDTGATVDAGTIRRRPHPD